VVIALPLGAAAEAAAGLLLIAAALAIAFLVADMLGALPVIGPSVGGAARNAMLNAIGRTVVWSQESARAMATVIFGPVYAVWTMIDALVTEDWQIVNTINALARWTIPNLRQWTWALVDANTRWLFATLNADVEWLKAYTYDTAQWVIAWATGEFARARAYTDFVKLSLWQALSAWVQILAQRIDSGLAQERAYADARVGQAIDYADRIGARDLKVIDQVAEQVAARAHLEAQQALEYTRAVAGQLARDVAGAEVRADAYAQALALPIAAAVSAIERSPCMRFCGPLGDLGGLLQGLEDAGLLALLLALLHDATHDPAQVERMISAVLVAPVKDAVHGLGLGIPA
jgi:hypothetical protein